MQRAIWKVFPVKCVFNKKKTGLFIFQTSIANNMYAPAAHVFLQPKSNKTHIIQIECKKLIIIKINHALAEFLNRYIIYMSRIEDVVGLLSKLFRLVVPNLFNSTHPF